MGNSLRRAATSGRTGLTYRERKHVRDSWQAFCRAKPDYGVLIFVEFFQRYPSHLQLFPPFGNLPLRDLVCNHTFRAHGSAVGHQITAMVDTLDDPDVMIELIRKNAVRHALKSGVKAEHFESLLHVMLETMQTRCPEHFTPDVIAAWTKLFDVVMTVTKPVFIGTTTPEQCRQATEAGHEDGVIDDAMRDPGGSSSGGTFSQLCSADSSKRASSASEFTVAPSNVSLPTVPRSVKERSYRRPAPSESQSTDVESAVDLHARP